MVERGSFTQTHYQHLKGFGAGEWNRHDAAEGSLYFATLLLIATFRFKYPGLAIVNYHRNI